MNNNNLFHFLLQTKRHCTSSSSERPLKGVKLNECTVAPTQEADYSSTVKQEGISSSSSKPGPSEKGQQKIDKKAKVHICSPGERVENSVIKASLPNVYNNQQLVQHIKNLADYTTKVLFVGSLFANFIFIKLLHDGQTIPIIEQSLFTNIFAVMTGNGKRAPHYLKEYFTLFCELITVDRESLKSINYSIIFSIAVVLFSVTRSAKKVFIMENVPSKFASKAYVYRKLRELPFTGALIKKSFDSLREETLQSINSNKTFAPGKKLAKLTSQQLKQEYKDGTLTPAKYTDKRTKSIQIDAQAFRRLVKQCGIPNYFKGKKTESDLIDFYYHLFNYIKLGFHTRDSLTSGKKKFKNVITTDGHSISFHFTRTVKRSLATTKNPSDFIDDIRNDCDIWAVDPGITSMIISLDSSGDNEWQRITSLDEYYHLCGYNDATFIRKKASKSSKLKFKTYLRRQKAVDEICKRLVANSKKYRQGSKTGVKTATKSNSRHCPSAPQDTMIPPAKTIVAFGNATFAATMKGKRAAPVKLIKKKIQMQTNVLQLDNITTINSKRRIHSALKCNNNSCNIVWNRDINAAKNIFDVFMFAAEQENKRHPAFERSKEQA
ncbi:hypothetical protein AB4K20DRAFT_1991562 [Rhizopus microsporus]|uniref:Uncharacterized protein n=1 Tax=Rhizopus microsporus TaxID=58291 RepID=A0A1X0RXF0_RHIZD|nr:hypothetical protein BCV71DRAFT_236416 [Rhizopus microsporus]